MGDRAPSPETRSGLSLRDTCRWGAHVYATQARFLLPLALVVFVPLGLVETLAEDHTELEAEEPSAGQIAGLLLAIGAQVCAAALGEVFYAGAVMGAVTETMEGKPRTPLGRLLRRLPYGRLIAVDVLFSLGLAFGIVLLIVPGLVFFARYVLTAPVLKIEGHGVRAGFRRSRELSRGHGVFLVVALGGLYLLTSVATDLLREGGLFLGDSFAAHWAVATAVEIVVTPVWAVGLCVVAWRLLQLERTSRAHGSGSHAASTM